jgi:outer membrane lipoprotein-sorting protein
MTRFFRHILFILLFMPLALPAPLARAAADAEALLASADAIRFPALDFQVEVTVTSTTADGDEDVRAYEILTKGNENTLIKTTAPAADRGQIMLMKGRDLWVYLPDLSQPVRLPLAQRLTGQVANGDLARANFTGDYTPRLSRSETIEGQRYEVLELTAVSRSVTYHRVLYWVNASNHRPLQAEFYALSGRLLKRCRYEAYEQLGGATRPTRLVMQDALKPDERSVLEYHDMKLKELPAKYFTKEYLRRLR